LRTKEISGVSTKIPSFFTFHFSINFKKNFKLTKKAPDDPSKNNPVFGPFFYPDSGVTYKGQYNDGLREGLGEQVWKDGSCYKGYFKNDLSSGKGMQVYASGDYYKGDWKEGMSHGYGEYYHTKDGIRYEGEWFRGEQHGYGKETYKDGSIYEGEC
jgi:hypothetical protein